MKKLLLASCFMLCFAVVASAQDVYKLGVCGSGNISYLLRYLPTGNTTADQGYSDTQVIDTLAEGIYDGSLTVIDAAAGTISVASNLMALTGANSWHQTAVYCPTAYAALLGRTVLSTIKMGNSGTRDLLLGWNDDTTPPSALEDTFYAIYFTYEEKILAVYGPGTVTPSGTAVGVYTALTDYYTAIVSGGYNSSGVPYQTGDTKADFTYGMAWYVKGGAYTSWTLMWKNETYSIPGYLFVIDNDAGDVDNISNLLIPQIDFSDILQPTHLSLMGSNGELSAYTPDVGPTWTENIGDWDTAAGVLQATALGIATFDASVDDVIYDVKVTTPGAGVTQGGLVCRGSDYTGGSEDYWYVGITPGTAGTDTNLWEINAGAAPVSRASADVDWAASTAYNIRVIVDGNAWWKVYSNGVEKLTYTAANNFNATDTQFGLRDEGNANFTFDVVGLWPRTSAAYDSAFARVGY